MGIRAIRTADPEVGGQAAGTAGGTGEPQLVKHLQHGGGILPVEGKGLLPLPQSGGGKGGLRGPLDGIAGAIAVAAQPALPGCGAAGFPRQDDPAAPNPGKAIGFGEGADLDGAAFGAGDGINAAGQLLPGKEGGVGGIHQQQAAGAVGPVHPFRHFHQGKGGAGGIIGGAEDD